MTLEKCCTQPTQPPPAARWARCDLGWPTRHQTRRSQGNGRGRQWLESRAAVRRRLFGLLHRAMRYVAGQQKAALPADTSIEGAVSIGPAGQGFGLQVELKISIPGYDKAQAQKLVEQAHQVCPYSNATRGNIDVVLTVV